MSPVRETAPMIERLLAQVVDGLDAGGVPRDQHRGRAHGIADHGHLGAVELRLRFASPANSVSNSSAELTAPKAVPSRGARLAR